MKVREEHKPSAGLRAEVLEALDEIPFDVVDELVFVDPEDYPYWEEGDEVAGWHETRSNTIYVNYQLDKLDWEEDYSLGGSTVLGLLAHEVGHLISSAVENKRVNGKRLSTIIGKYYAEDRFTPSEYAAENRDEYFAECFALYIMRPQKLTEKQKEMIDLVLWMHEKK